MNPQVAANFKYYLTSARCSLRQEKVATLVSMITHLCIPIGNS